MRILTFLFVITSLAVSQQKDYGERNGYDWKSIGSWLARNIEQTTSLDKKSWIEGVTKEAKTQFIVGMMELSTRIPSENFGRYKDEKGKWQYYESSHPYPHFFGTTPDQMVKGLGTFYDDYRNMNVLILDAVHIVQMQIKGKTDDEIDWQIRYYRADEDTRWQMVREKYSKSKK